MFKKSIKVLLSMLIIFSLVACGGNKKEPEDTAANEKTSEKEETTKKDSNRKKDNDIKSIDELEVALSDESNIKVTIESVDYVVQDANYKSLYPDMLRAILKNNSEQDIKSAVVAFAAWDENNLPVKLKGSIDFKDPTYIRQVLYDDINLVPGSTYGEQGGYEIDSSIQVSTIKAIVVSYETFEGEKWENPLYKSWEKLYSGVKL